MASPAYVWILDDQGNPMHSNCDVTGREKSIEALSFAYGVNMPVDKFTGTTTGTRQHDTAMLVKSYCPASPYLFDSACHGKTLQSVRIAWYEINTQGKEEEYFTHLLEDVKVVSYRQRLRHIKDEQNNCYTHEDEVAFRFAKITLKHHDGNIEASDTWVERG